MVPMINASGCENIINIDYHQDYVYLPERLDEATVFSYIDQKEQKFLEWRYPSFKECIEKRAGICDYECFGKDFFHTYSKQSYREGLRNIPWQDVSAASICISPNHIWPVVSKTLFSVFEQLDSFVAGQLLEAQREFLNE
jgi:hypothetical protein